MSDLQRALDRSIEKATPFTKNLFEDQWDAARVAAFVNANRNLTIATVTAQGRPHASVVIGACLGGEIHFTVAPESLLWRNLARSPHLAFTVSDRSHAVMGRGVAALAGRSLESPELMWNLAAATASGTFTPAGWDGLIYRIEPETIFAN
jgi:hypothetical protein